MTVRLRPDTSRCRVETTHLPVLSSVETKPVSTARRPAAPSSPGARAASALSGAWDPAAAETALGGNGRSGFTLSTVTQGGGAALLENVFTLRQICGSLRTGLCVCMGELYLASDIPSSTPPLPTRAAAAGVPGSRRPDGPPGLRGKQQAQCRLPGRALTPALPDHCCALARRRNQPSTASFYNVPGP